MGILEIFVNVLFIFVKDKYWLVFWNYLRNVCDYYVLSRILINYFLFGSLINFIFYLFYVLYKLYLKINVFYF